MSFSEWIILHTGGQTWYNYFIPPISVHEIFHAKVDKGGISKHIERKTVIFSLSIRWFTYVLMRKNLSVVSTPSPPLHKKDNLRI